MSFSPRPSFVIRYRFTLRYALLISLLVTAFCWDGRSSAQGGQQIRPLVVVSAASFRGDTPFAPGSIVSAFTSGVLPPGTTLPDRDADPSTPIFDPPVTLGNLTVEVHGRSARIFGIFGPPLFEQINILIPAEAVPGKGPIVVKDATGRILAAGEIEMAEVAPAIFTANIGGAGVPAGNILRALGSGVQQYEELAEYSPGSASFVPRPIDLERGDELTFLVLYMTGAKGIAKEAQTRVVIGGAEYIPTYVGPTVFPGVEQINLLLPRSLPTGLLRPTFVYLPNNSSADVGEIEIAPPTGAPPSIRGLSKVEALAGEIIEVTGTGFTPDSEVLISDATRKLYNSQVMESAATSMKVMVPYGSGAGSLIVRNARGEASFPFKMRTSMSGIVQRIERSPNGIDQRVGIRNVTIRIKQNNVERTTMTGEDGAFLIPDVQQTARLTFEVDGTTNGILPLPKDVRSLPILTGRDNQYEGYIELKAITGPSAVGMGEGVFTHSLIAPVRTRDGATQQAPVVFDPQGSTIRFPDGSTANSLTVTVLDPGRVPANLPPAQFSSTIVQLTPFGAALTPGGRLTLPNTDGYAPNDLVTLYRFDQTPGSNTLGQFVAAGLAQVSADGIKIETAPNAIKESTYYFVSKTRSIATLYGKVEEEIGGGVVQAARGALVQVRGQSIFSLTDQSGTYTLRNVPIPDANTLARGFTIEVSYLRPDGTVDRAEREGVIPRVAGLTLVSPPIRVVNKGRSRAPVIQVPKSLIVEAGKESKFNFLAYARVAGQTLTSVQVIGAAFVSVVSLGGDKYTLVLNPATNATGNYTLELRATDSQGERTSETVFLEVKAAQSAVPVALSQSVETNEDGPVNINLMGSGGDRFRVVSEPRRGRLSGVAPNLAFTPENDFAGTDSFSFVVGNGTVESALAFVTINVRPVDDPPLLTVGDSFSANIGQRLAIVINGYDGDAGQKLTLMATGLRTGATIRQTTATSWLFEWQTANERIGSNTINLTLSDDGTPVRSVSKAVTITLTSSNLVMFYKEPVGDWRFFDLSMITGGVGVDAAPAMLVRGDTLHAFVRGADGRLLQFYKESYKELLPPWQVYDLSAAAGGTLISSAPSVLHLSTNVTHVFARGTGGQLLHFYKEPNPFQWQVHNISALSGGRLIGGAPTGLQIGDSTQVFVRGTGGQLLQFYKEPVPKEWQVFDLSTDTGGAQISSSGAPVALQTGIAVQIFARAADGRLVQFYKEPNPKIWQVHYPPVIAGGRLIGSNPAVLYKESSTDIFARGTDGRLLQFHNEPLSVDWQVIDISPADFFSDDVAVIQRGNAVHVYGPRLAQMRELYKAPNPAQWQDFTIYDLKGPYSIHSPVAAGIGDNVVIFAVAKQIPQ